MPRLPQARDGERLETLGRPTLFSYGLHDAREHTQRYNQSCFPSTRGYY